MPIKANSALLVANVQNDFCPGGAMPVSDGHRIVPRLNAYIQLFRAAGRPVLASRDWHPAQTGHFVTQGGPWPVHCVRGTPGAEFFPGLSLPPDVLIFSKGLEPDEAAYSVFRAVDDAKRSLSARLHVLEVTHLYIGGLALEYCVKDTALDALREGIGVTVMIDATRALNEHPHDGEIALEELVRHHVELVTVETLSEE
jgi:nicotinamidase/pyrazinamidase